MSISSIQESDEFSKSELAKLHSTEILLRSKSTPSQPVYQNLISEENPSNSEFCAILRDPTKLKSKPILIPVTPDLPPRPVLQPKKPVKCMSQNGLDTTKGMMSTPIKSCTKARCISPSPSIISSSSTCSQQSRSLQRCKHTPKSNNAMTLRRPHVLHRRCSLNMAQLEKLSSMGPSTDIVIVYSKLCQVSADWAHYFKALYESANSVSQIYDISSSKSGTSIKVKLQEVEEFSSKVYQLNSSSSSESKIRQELIELEERTYHAKCHLVIVGYHFLEWVYRNPSLIVGTLFGDVNSNLWESNSDTTGSTIGLLLGVTAKDVKAEHRAALLTFQQWQLMDIEEETSEVVNSGGPHDPTFSERLFKATLSILKRDDEIRKEQHYRIPSTVHMSTPPSPTYNVPQTVQMSNSGSFFSSSVLSSETIKGGEPSFRILSDNFDTPSINAIQRSLVLILSKGLVLSKDNIECSFVCVEQKPKSDDLNYQSEKKENVNSLNGILDDTKTFSKNENNQFGAEFGEGLQTQVKTSRDESEVPSESNLLLVKPSLPPKQNKPGSSNLSKEFENGYEMKKTVIKLESCCPSSHLVKASVSKKVFARLCSFLSHSQYEDIHCDRYVTLELKVNGNYWKPTNGAYKGNKGQLIKLETPLSTLEHLVEMSTLVAASTLNCVNGNKDASLYGLDQNLASFVSHNVPVDLFSWMIEYEAKNVSYKGLNQVDELFPTLIHWAAHNGFDKLVMSLLNLPGSNIASQQLNCNKKSASEMAKSQGYPYISELIESRIPLAAGRLMSDKDHKPMPSKLLSSEKMHVYEYPNVQISTKIDSLNTNGNDFNPAVPPTSNISPPPTPPSVSKLYDLKIEYEKSNRKYLRNSSLSSESWTPSTNRSSTVSTGLADLVNNDLYDIPRFSNPIASPKMSSQPSNVDDFGLEISFFSKSVETDNAEKYEPDKPPETNNQFDINETQGQPDADSIAKKPTEYSYIPMQPRCNSTGQSSYCSSSTDNRNSRSESSPDYNSMGRKKKSNSTSCIHPAPQKISIVKEKKSPNDTVKEICPQATTSKAPLLSTNNFLGLRSTPKPRHEFMKTYCNFSNQEALLCDDFSPYVEKCDVKSINEDATLGEASRHENLENGTSNTSELAEKPASSLSMGFTPTLIAKLKKPIEKCDSLTLPPRTPKKKWNKKLQEHNTGSSTLETTSKLNRSESLSSAANNPVTASNLRSEHFPNISKPIKQETLHKSGENDINSEFISGVMKKEENDIITPNPLWSKLKGLSTGTLKRSKKRNRSENSTSS